MEKQKTRLGARVLSEAEMKLILPDAESVYEQIEVFRRNSVGAIEDEYEQKTNNIGIMGCRGAGKTSILKTFHQRIKEKNDTKEEKDIMLPIIVPENMSEGTALMDVVLGMLKPVVEARKKEAERQGECIYSGRNNLEKAYNEMVKQYCYIKRDYRDVLIQQFTTEQYYVDKTKEIFNSDTEFIKQFRHFIQLLLNEEKNNDSQAMIFLFIDDIDLSTTKCMDVVRTLLSYLSHPRIITFISGDMITFEESLTLEFLRQEYALERNVFKYVYSSSMEDDSNELVERKRALACEYLKKIIPPAYRKNIKYWSLEERGHYRVWDGKENNQKNLGEMLEAVTGMDKIGAYFSYMESGERKFLNVMFQLLDNTPRGLNNVYNVLRELNTIETRELLKKSDSKAQAMQRLLQTIIYSKPLYVKYRKQIVTRILIEEQQRIRVNFKNAESWLYGKDEKDKKNRVIFSAQEKFAIFLLADFTANIFGQDTKEDAEYELLKNKIIFEYIGDETIEGKVTVQRANVYWDMLYENDDKKNREEQIILNELLRKGDFIFDIHFIRYLGRDISCDILNGKVQEESVYNLAYALSRTLEAINKNEEYVREYLISIYYKMQKSIIKLLNMLSTTPEVIYGTILLPKANIKVAGMEHYVQNKSLTVVNFKNIKNYMAKGSSEMSWSKFKLMWASYGIQTFGYWKYYEDTLREKSKEPQSFDLKKMAERLAEKGTIKMLMNYMQPFMNEFEVGKTVEAGYDLTSMWNDTKEKQVICQIDKNNLWHEPYVKKQVVDFFKRTWKGYLDEFEKGRLVFDASGLLKKDGVYREIERLVKEKGSKKTLIYQLHNKLRKGLWLLGKRLFADGKYYMRLEHVLIILCMLQEFLENHPKMVYGKAEVRQLLMEIHELPLVVRTSSWKDIQQELEERENLAFLEQVNYVDISSKEGEINNYLELKEQVKFLKEKRDITEQSWEGLEKCMDEQDFRFYLHSYIRCLQANDENLLNVGVLAESVAKLAKQLLECEPIADKRMQNTVYEIVSKEMELTEEEFENLFK